MADALKLRAIDEDDLAVVSAVLQDALVPPEDMCFLPGEKRFVLVASRFCWECTPNGEESPARAHVTGAYQRVHCGITIEHVTRVQSRGFTPGRAREDEPPFEVLAILCEPEADGGGEAGAVVTLLFSGDAAVRLEVEKLELLLGDVGEPWPTLWRPRHALENDPGPE